MAAFKETVRSYSANLNPNKKQVGCIIMTCDTARLVVGFLDPADAIQPNTYDPATKIGNGFQPFSSFPFYLDLLRNGTPVTVTFRPDDVPPTFIVVGSK